ncbi:unnamed protein product [Peniophora sp. CBMAI 1063]|nr:unnamed protein product [Peniophora sp. CBMAI 1063]
MATAQHYVWAGGHFVLLFAALRYILFSLLYRHPSVYFYRTAFIGALASYVIVCQKSLGIPQAHGAYLRRALADENVQYLLLALFWFTSRPVTVALLPYVIFSTFHALTFVRTTVIPMVAAPGPPATAGGPPTPHPIAKKLQTWVKEHYDQAMRIVAYAECAILARVAVGALLRQNSFLTPIIFAHFLRMRYFQSPFTKAALGRVIYYIDDFANKPDSPPMAKQVWGTVQQLVGRWTGATMPPRTANAAAPAAAAR